MSWNAGKTLVSASQTCFLPSPDSSIGRDRRSPISQAYKCSCRLRCHNPLKNSARNRDASRVSSRTKDDFIFPCPVTNTGFSAGRSISCQSPANPFIPNRLNQGLIKKPCPLARLFFALPMPTGRDDCRYP